VNRGNISEAEGSDEHDHAQRAGDLPAGTMPGLTTHPAAEHIDVDADGRVVGLS
jgi:hypothetical protein